MDNCGFGKLSAELRNQIYDYVLPENRKIEVYSINRRKPVQDYQPPITQVCKEMRAETLPMFYDRNKFELPLIIEGQNGVHWHEHLEKSVAQAEAWLRRNPAGLPLSRSPLVISADFDAGVLSENWYDHKQPWVELANVLRANRYTKEMYVLEIFADYFYLFDHDGQHLLHEAAMEERAVRKAFRAMGLRCKVTVLGP